MNFNHFKQLQQICVCAWHFTHDVPVGGCYKCFFIVMKRFLGPNPPSSSVLKPTTSGPFALHLLSDMDFLVAYSNFKVRCNRDRYIDCEFRWKKDYNVGLFIGLFFIRVCASCWVYTHARRTTHGGTFFFWDGPFVHSPDKINIQVRISKEPLIFAAWYAYRTNQQQPRYTRNQSATSLPESRKRYERKYKPKTVLSGYYANFKPLIDF